MNNNNSNSFLINSKRTIIKNKLNVMEMQCKNQKISIVVINYNFTLFQCYLAGKMLFQNVLFLKDIFHTCNNPNLKKKMYFQESGDVETR